MEGTLLISNINYIILIACLVCLAVDGFSITNDNKDLQENSLNSFDSQKFGKTALKQLGKIATIKKHSMNKREVGFNNYYEILDALKKQEFKRAQEIYKKNNYDTLSLIQEMYANEEISFSNILKFIISNFSINKRLLAYKTLSKIVINYDSLNQSLQLKENIRKYIIDDVDSNITIRNQAHGILSYLDDRIKSLVSETLINKIEKETYTSKDQFEILNKVYLNDVNLFHSIMKKVVDNVYGKVSNNYLWLVLASQSYPLQTKICFELLWDKMKRNGDNHLNMNTVDILLNMYAVQERLRLNISLPDIQNEALDLFLDHFLHYEHTEEEIDTISKKICDFDNRIFDNIIYSLIENMDGRMGIILKCFTTRKYYTHSIIAYMAVFNYMKSKNALKIAPVTVKPLLIMQEFFENLSSEENIKKVKKGLRIKIESIKKQLPDIKKEMINTIKNSIKNDNYDSSEILNLTNEICTFNMDIFLNIVKHVIEDLYANEKVEKLIDYSKSHLYIEPEIVSLTILFDKLSSNNRKFEFEFANAFKNIMSYPNLNLVSYELIQRLKEYNMKLNPSIRNAVFLDRVCIKNIDSREFLYASSSIYDHNRSVITQNLRSNDVGSEWKILKANEYETFRIKSLKYNEYLYVNRDELNQCHQVFTWTTGELLKESKWKMIPFNDSVILKAVHSNENLHTQNNEEGKMHIACTSFLEKTRFAKWKIEECR
ncbi:uncharacterized protein LOC106669915 isoform X1 [Cimex lectularius]|uniref:Uncharacterized protein n=1 Tax=Cimex lectularius TaxID=79782 RepID=A0A8I6S3D3_CIMLE|nr:uncharacterized protein LOC106669915 isoform X1 [Cimex lectularius]XP_014255265.1 uncharacterized protein LOC106669915 isoform X1 [Cimex lectularius]